MSSSLRVNTIVPSTGTNVAIGTANGTVTFTDSVNFVLGTGSSIFSPASNTLTFGTNDAERLRLTSGGSVAIGVNSPSDKLHVGGNNAFIRVDRPNGNPGLTLIYNSTNSTRADIDVTTGGDLRFATNDSTERLRITSAGNIGVKVTNPDLTLHVNGVNALPSTSGSTPTGHLTLRAKAQSSSHGMFMGVSNASPWSSWIQAQDANNNATNYPLLLNPNGGNVGVNVTNPSTSLHVAGSLTLEEASATGNAWTYYKNADRTWLVGIRGSSNDALSFYDLTTDVERLRITSDGKLGAGTASPNHRLTLHNSGTGTFDALNITSGLTNSVGLQLGIDSASNVFFWHTANGGIKFATNNVERMRVTNNGITFNGDTAAANALDDYEEGNFTPIVRGRTTAGTASYGRTAVGKYTKVGRMVSVIVDMVFSGANGNGNVEIAGLPFAAHSGPYVRFAGDVTLLTAGLSWSNQIACYINDNNSHFWITNTPTSGNYSFVNINSNTTEILLHCTYMVS